MPFVDENNNPVNLSPEEQSQYWQHSGQQPPGTLVDESGKPVDPFALPAADIANLVKQAPDKFDLVSQFAARPELQKDPATVAKVADAFHQLRESPIDWKDVASHAPENVAKVISGLAQYGLKVTSGTIKQLASLGFAAGSTDAAATAQEESRQELGEAAASAEQGMTGLVSGTVSAAGALARGLHLAKPLKEYNQADKVNALFDALAKNQQTQATLSGQGPLAQAVTGGAVQVRPEETAKLTDPFSWEAFGLGTQAVGAAVDAGKGAISAVAPQAAKLAEKIPSVPQVAGNLITGASKVGAFGARAVEKVAEPISAVGAPVYALATHDPKLLAESLIFGSAAGEKAVLVAEKAAKGLDAAADFGKQVSSGEVKSAYAAAVRDALEATPKAAGQLATGVGFDLSQIAGADTPQERESAAGLGTAFGMLGAANTVGRHVLSGQIVGPRAFSTDTPIPSSGQFPALDAMHNQEFSNLTPGQRTRINAVRQYLSKANPDADVFVANAFDPHNTALTKAMVESGIDPATAQTYANQEGVATRLNGRKVIVVKEPGAAPHEAFHGIEDVLGEGTLRNIDPEIQKQYGNQWEGFGRYYASRLLGADAGDNWRDVILDKSGWGSTNAAEKQYADVARQFSDEARKNGQPPPTEQQVRDAVQAAGVDWRTSLSPEEQKAVADRYVSRELLAENFDAWFKHTGGTLEPGKQLPERIARTLGSAMQFFGANPVAGRTSEGLNVPLTPQSIEAARQLGKQAVAPTVEPAKSGAAAAPTAGVAAPEAAQTARQLAADQPNVPLPGQNQSQREIAGAAAEAFANDAALHLQYSSAPDEPAASLSLGMNRVDRRGLIQAFREMPDNVRQLFGKLFFPKKFVQTKASGLQIQGWSPEVFAANAHRYGRFLSELAARDPAAAQRLTKYEVGPQGLTAAGWQELHSDLQNFVASQRAGKTGAGESLVVPRKVTDAGYYAPPTVGAPGEQIPQGKADVINMLFGFRLPGKEGAATRAGGAAGVRLPQNIAGQLVSAATQPGRVSVPVSPRGDFGGAAAERQGVAGQPVMEVNPYRAQLEAAAKAAGVPAPSMIESWQNLNLNRIKEAQVAAEQPKFGANPLTLQAGFLPAELKPGEGPTPFPSGPEDASDWPKFHHLVGMWLSPDGKFFGANPNHYNTAEAHITGHSGKEDPRELAYKKQWIRVNVDGSENTQGILVEGPTPNPSQARALRDAADSQELPVIRDDGRAILGHQYSNNTSTQFLPKQPVELTGPDGKKYKATFDGFQDFSAIGKGKIPQFTAMEDLPGSVVAKSTTYGPSLEKAGYKLPQIDESTAQFSPKADDVAKVADDYMLKNRGTVLRASAAAEPNEPLMHQLADFYENAEHTPGAPAVKKSYDALAKETVDQYNTIRDAGYDIQPYRGTGEPYKSSAEMVADVADNKHLYYLPTTGSFGGPTDNLMLQPSGIGDAPVNDIFRAVHDFFGHAKEGYQFGPKGEFNAWREHSKMFSPDAQGALAAETLAQNSWVNFGKHLRIGESGAVPKKGENGYIPAPDRPFAEQKNTVLPTDLINRAKEFPSSGGTQEPATIQSMPKRRSKEDWKLKEGDAGMFSKAWITPDGKPVQLGGQWHHEWVNNNPEIASKYGLKPSTSGEENRVDALKKGFARVNYEKNTGTLKVEARAADWPKLAPSVREMVANNLQKIDNMDVHLLDAKAKNIVDSDGVRLHTYEPEERMQQLPFISAPGSVVETSPQASSAAAASVGGQYLPSTAPRALRSAAVRDPETGQIFEAPFHAMAVADALGLPSYRNADEKVLASFEHGFTTNEGEFLDRAASGQRAEEMKQLDKNATAAGSEKKGGIGIEHLKNEVLTEMQKNRKNAIPNIVTQFLPADFKDEKRLPEALKSGRYAIITANREAVGSASHPTNQSANDALEQELVSNGYTPLPVSGEYKGVDQGRSYLVPGMPLNQALAYGKRYGQESVLTPEGLAYTDGTFSPAVPADTIVGAAAKKRDGWSQVAGGAPFSMGIDFDKRAPLDLFGNPIEEAAKKAGLSSAEKGKLTKAELTQQYPEAVIPRKRDQAVPSDILGSPLYKEAVARGGEAAAVNAFADRLVSFAKEYSDRPAFKDGALWYDNIAPAIKKAFGKTGQVFAELLAATSPGQVPDLNFKDALQAHDRLVAGDYDKKLEKYSQGLEMAADEKKWKSWLAKHGVDLPATPTPETFLGQWIDFHDLKLTKHNGKLFGHNSVPVLNVAARKWIADAGPKTSNFVKNLLGVGHDATIDLWADRTMRWAGYEGSTPRWRILPENKSGVDDKDFYFAQKVFAAAAKRLNLRPDQLQGALWFAEKQRWADNGWSPLNLGTYEPEFAKIPETRARVAQEQQLRELGAKIKPLTGTQVELMVSPRNLL